MASRKAATGMQRTAAQPKGSSPRGKRQDNAPLARLLQDYRPFSGVSDELMAHDGSIRPVWRKLAGHLEAMDPEDLQRRFARGDQYLHDAGVFYRQYGSPETSVRDWPLSHVPVLIDEAEWRMVAAGLVQRANLLEAVAADLYGENTLVRDGFLPPSLIASSPEWLRPMVGVKPRSGHYLHFIAFEIGRGPDGTWWVLGDRTQAPSGSGFAVENRVATTRVFSELFAQSNVHRLAGFFRAFRDALMGLREEPDSRVGILTPGPLTDTYYEHAYIARYLGFSLLEGEDLTVENGRLMVRTVAGLTPISVLWRRLDASWADPLELDERSRLGTPGLIDALRRQSLSMVNALGAGVLETRALLAFLPRISEALLGEPLALPNIATWWCGQAAEREHVKANAGRMMIDRALSTQLPFETADTAVIGGRIRETDYPNLGTWIDAEGGALVGQEAVTLSSTPAFENGRFVPRPMSLRLFLARTPEGWTVMPGGFARIGCTDDPAAIAMQKGGSVADVWVVSERPVATETMLPQTPLPYRRGQPGSLPARAADNLFWLGRYVERAEGLFRLTRAYNARLMESDGSEVPLLVALKSFMDGCGVDADEPIPEGLNRTMASAITSAGQIRDRFSVDGWMALSDLAVTMRRMTPKVGPGDDAARAMSVFLRKIAGFSGLVHENMYRFTGWRFLSIGRSLERALTMAEILIAFTDPETPDGGLDLAVELGDSAMSHRRRFAVETRRQTVVDLLALDTLNPRAILYQLEALQDHIHVLPGIDEPGRMSPLSRAILQAHTGLAVQTPETLDTDVLATLRDEIAELSIRLTEAYLS